MKISKNILRRLIKEEIDSEKTKAILSNIESDLGEALSMVNGAINKGKRLKHRGDAHIKELHDPYFEELRDKIFDAYSFVEKRLKG
jgi:hypothetical protein